MRADTIRPFDPVAHMRAATQVVANNPVAALTPEHAAQLARWIESNF